MNVAYLLDTNILSEWSKSKPNVHVISWLQSLERLQISGMTLLEIRYGLLLNKSPYKERWFRFIRPAVTVLPAWDSVFEDATQLLEYAKRKGVSPSPADVVIAAYARKYSLTLATRNVKDFDSFGIPLHNPFL